MAIQCEMAKGSVLLWTGATLHAGGSNSTDAVRKSVLSGYVCSWLRSEHRFWAHRLQVRCVCPNLRCPREATLCVPGHFAGPRVLPCVVR